MENRRTKSYWKCLDKLGVNIDALLERTYDTWLNEPQSNGLEFTFLHDDPLVARVRVGDHYRAIMVIDGETAVWFWIGTHEDYNKYHNKPARKAAKNVLKSHAQKQSVRSKEPTNPPEQSAP